MADYVGIIDRSGDAWGERIPDLPGCYGAAALRDAASAARKWIAQGEGLGRARKRAIDEILAACDVDVAAGGAAVSIGVLIDEGRTLRANVTFDSGLLGAIDAAALKAAL